MAKEAVSNWQKWCDLPSWMKCGSLVELNETDIIVSTSKFRHIATPVKDQTEISGIYIFNILEKKWKILMEYPKNWNLSDVSSCYDNESHLYYSWHFPKEVNVHKFNR